MVLKVFNYILLVQGFSQDSVTNKIHRSGRAKHYISHPPSLGYMLGEGGSTLGFFRQGKGKPTGGKAVGVESVLPHKTIVV